MSSVFSLNALEQFLPAPRLPHARRNFSRARRPNAGVARMRCIRESAIHNMKPIGDDSECMARLANGDADALRELYQRHGRALLRFSSAMCRSRQAAEDIVHDTFVALLREPTSFDPAQGTVFGYLCGVLRHRVSRHFRQERRWVALDTENDTSPAHLSATPGPAEEIARSEISAAFRRAMLELPLQHREVIALCDLEELPYTTVAGILCCPIGTVRSRLHRARALLTIRLASLELIDLQNEPSMAHRGLS
jgi:RNA polymerase sigma-70 factor (ECF subfamily)